jgi:hypothetical protein
MPYKAAYRLIPGAYRLIPTLPVVQDVGALHLIVSRYAACMVHTLVAI